MPSKSRVTGVKLAGSALGAVLLLLPGPMLKAREDAAPKPAASAIDQTWWTHVRDGLSRYEYHPSLSNNGLQAPNRAHNLRTYFEASGIRVHDRTSVGGPALVSMSLAGLGRGPAPPEVKAGVVQQVGSRVEIRRPGVTEWYENSARGLEQGFTIPARVKGNGALILELALERATARMNGKTIELTTDAGRRLEYGKLLAEDTKGRVLASRMEVPSPKRLRLVIDDAEAAYPLLIDPLLTGVPDFRLESNQPDPQEFLPAAFGGGVAAAGDVNGDGFADVIVGAPGWDGGDAHEGAAFVFLGSASGIVGSDPSNAHARIESNQFGAQLGTISGAGDVNGDGFDDIVVGAHFYDSTLPGTSLRVDGAAFVFHGSAAGITGTDPATADARILANQLNSDLGLSVAGAGDVNGDGFGDIIIGVPDEGHAFPEDSGIDPNQRSGSAGAALVFHGSAAGITGTGFDDADAVLLPYEPSDLEDPVELAQFGGVAGAGDVNNDGFDDVLVGGTDLFLFLGGPAGVVGRDPTTAQSQIPADAGGGGLIGAAAGDVNGDGFADIIAGDAFLEREQFTRAQEGAAYVFLGGPQGIVGTSTAGAHATFFGSLLAEWVGASVAGAGDTDGDGFDDVLVAARVYPGSLESEGVAYLFRGSASGITAGTLLDADVRLEARQSGAVVLGNDAAFSVAGAGDINADGFADVIMGKGYYDAGEENEGAAFIYMGGARPADPNKPPVAVAGDDQVVFDTDADGFQSVTVDGSGSFDVDGFITSFAWFEGETLLGTSAVLTTTLPATGDHTLALVVTDDDGVSRGDPVTVRVDRLKEELVFFDTFSSGLVAWTINGDVVLSSVDSFPSAPQARLGASGASMRRAISLPADTTGMTLDFWGKARQFSAGDELLVKVSVDGGPFTTIKALTAADSTDSYIFYGGTAIPVGHSWFPATASTIVLEFESRMTTGQFFVDDVKVSALIAPAGTTQNQPPTAHAGADQTVIDSDGDGVETVTLDGSAASDPDGIIASYEWREGTTLLGQGVTVNVPFGVGVHTVTLTVIDDAGGSANDTVAISVETPEAPDPPASLASDDFESGSFSGGTGRWAGSWSTGGEVLIRTGRDGPHSGTSHVRLRKSSAFLRRTADLAGASGVHLTFWGKASQFSGSDRLLVEVSVDGGPFTTVGSITSAASDNTYRLYDIDLSGFPTSSNVQIEFDAEMNNGSFYLDDVDIAGSLGPAPDQAPIADAGPNQAAGDSDGNGTQSFTLDGSGSTDPDGAIASYAWHEGTTLLGTGAAPVVTLGVGGHTIILTVTDGDGLTATDTTTITVTANRAPVAAAGTDQVVNDSDFSGSEAVTVSGSGSFDPDGTIAAFEWREGSVTLGMGEVLTTTLGVGTHTLTLTVTDNGGATASDSTVVTVSLNQAPAANAGPDQTITDADGDTTEVVTFDGSASTDPDGTIVSYRWTKNGTPFGNTATFSVTQPIGTHTVELTVTDDQGATSTDTVVVTIVQPPPPADNLPPVADAGPDQTVTDTDGDGIASVTLDGTASSDPDGTVSGYGWWEGPELIATSFRAGVPLTVGIHTITLIVTDEHGASGSDDVVITVNAAPAGMATLTVTATGRTGERVVSSPAGIDVAVGGTGSASFAVGTQITLSATDGRDVVWSGACATQDKQKTCTFTLDGNASVNAEVQ